jgi:hypothetical protein
LRAPAWRPVTKTSPRPPKRAWLGMTRQGPVPCS